MADHSKVDIDALYWCWSCDEIQKCSFNESGNKDATGQFIGGDIACNECHFIVATGYVRTEQAAIDLAPQKVSAAGVEFDSANMALPLNALLKAGFSCDAALTAKLWSRFSKDQCATWIEIADDTVERFVTWVKSDLDRDEAWG